MSKQDCEWCGAEDVPVLYYETIDPPDAETGEGVVWVCEKCERSLHPETADKEGS